MVFTRRCSFEKGEKVLCYEPDPKKAKVLYDSKILGTYESKDKRGRKIIQYKVHFQGWSSSWDRKVNADFVLKDTEVNRQLQRDLASKAQLCLESYLYRKERVKKKSRKSSTSLRNTSESGGSSASAVVDSSGASLEIEQNLETIALGTITKTPTKNRHYRISSEDNFSSGSTSEKHELTAPMDDNDYITDSEEEHIGDIDVVEETEEEAAVGGDSGGSGRGAGGAGGDDGEERAGGNSSVVDEDVEKEKRVGMNVSSSMRACLEFDRLMVVTCDRRHALPNRLPVVVILENWIKHSAIKLIAQSSKQTEGTKRRSTQQVSGRREREFEKVLRTITLLKEVADGLRIYFDFTLRDCLVYPCEKIHTNNFLTSDFFKNYVYTPRFGILEEFAHEPKCKIDETKLSKFCSNMPEKQDPDDIPSTSSGITNEPRRRKVRQQQQRQRNDDMSDMTFEQCLELVMADKEKAATKEEIETPTVVTAVTVATTEPSASKGKGKGKSGGKGKAAKGALPKKQPEPEAASTQSALLPQAKVFLRKLLMTWTLLPAKATPVPSMFYGPTHLGRLLVKMPQFLNKTTWMSDEKLKVLLKNLDLLLIFYEAYKDWFTEENYELLREPSFDEDNEEVPHFSQRQYLPQATRTHRQSATTAIVTAATTTTTISAATTTTRTSDKTSIEETVKEEVLDEAEATTTTGGDSGGNDEEEIKTEEDLIAEAFMRQCME